MFLLLDAGDIPSPTAITSLIPLMADDRVAVAIGQSLMADDDSAEHGPNGLHELAFERQTLNPALGARGAAILSESGALIRRAAIDSVEIGDEEPIEAQAQWSLSLMNEGWSVVAASGDPVVVRQVVQSQDDGVRATCAARPGMPNDDLRPDGILRLNSLRLGQRLAIVASAVRPAVGPASRRVHWRRRSVPADGHAAAASEPHSARGHVGTRLAADRLWVFV